MNIDKHKWSDESFDFSLVEDGNNAVTMYFHEKVDSIYLEKQDAIAIAKHFNVDNESLVEGIKELIEKIEKEGRHNGVSDGYYCAKDGLQKLITKEDIEE